MKTKRIAGYEFELPRWWRSVRVVVPANLKNWQQLQKYVSGKYGRDVGTRETWKQALKVYAIAYKRLNIFPVHLAHCYMSGRRYAKAAKMYGELYELADTRRKEKDWNRSYLAYEAGCTYALLGDLERAAMWYSRSAEFVGHPNGPSSFYAKESVKRLKELKK